MSSGRKRVKRKESKNNEESEIEKTAMCRPKNVNGACSGSKGHLSIEEVEQMDDDFQSRISELESSHQAAFRFRLDPLNLCTDEERELPYLKNSSNAAQRKMYLSSRNFILSEWVKNMKSQLTYPDVHASLFSNGLAFTKEQTTLSCRAYGFLERYGYINFGVFSEIEPKPRSCKSVVVIGAGISGLACARHLKYLGFDVTVLEAKERAGGRIQTFRKGNYVADLGAMVVTGLGGNPLAMLAHQFNVPFRRIKNDCKLYNHLGEEVPKAKDAVIEQEFNRLLDAAKYAAAQLGFVETIPGRPVSLGQTIELIIMHQEQTLLKKKEKFFQNLVNLQKEIRDRSLEAQSLYQNIEQSKAVVKKYESKSTRNVIEEFQFKSAVHNSQDFITKYRNVMKEIKNLQAKFDEIKDDVPIDTYLSTEDRNILDWHFANLEFANATPLNTLSLSQWDQDDHYEMPGDHYSVQSGLGVITDTLASDLNIKFKKCVRNIDYSASAVSISCLDVTGKSVSKRDFSSSVAMDLDPDDDDEPSSKEEFRADAVVVSVPLGVLKEEPPLINFNPELPDWKLSAIDRLGFGNLMKVVLCFEKKFWDSSTHMFGFVNSHSAARGECYLFNSLWDAPVLVALIAGESTVIMDELDDDSIVQRCLTCLRTLYPDTISRLKEKIVTRWRDDMYCCGAYSYVAIGASGEDYDAIAKPVSGLRSGKCNLFFAGEHTMRNYPATAHGALLSGLNCAAQVADQLIGGVNTSYSQ